VAELGRRSAAHRAAQRRDAPFEFFVDLFELIEALELINANSEATKHGYEQESQPKLQAPA